METKNPNTMEESSTQVQDTENIQPVSSESKSSKKVKGKQNDKDAGLTEEERKLREQQRKRAASKKRKKILKTLVTLLIIALIAAFFVFRFIQIKKSEKEATNLVTYTVERRSITEKLSATGTLMPLSENTVSAKVKGNVLARNFEEGDDVKEGDVLYVIDKNDMTNTLERSQRNLEKAQDSLNDAIEKRNELVEYSDLSGIVQELYVEEGDTLNKGMVIADIVDKTYMLADIPFHSSHAVQMKVGDVITVIIEGSGEELSGNITKISASEGTNAFGAPTRDVTVKVKNPGGISKATKAQARYSEEQTSTDFGSFYYYVEEQLKSEYSGQIQTLYIKEGSTVRYGQDILVYDDETIEKQITESQRNYDDVLDSYEDVKKNLEEYEITAPVSGNIVEMNFNVGESIDVTGGNQTVARIYDLSALKFEMNIDELDIFLIEKGQKVSVTTEALSGQVFYGEITKISKVGSVSSGTTTYPVTVTITDKEALSKLLPWMNVDAEIVVNHVENVIAVPSGAITRGGTIKVVKNPEALKENLAETENRNNSSSDERKPSTQGTIRPEGMQGQPPESIPTGKIPEGMPATGVGETAGNMDLADIQKPVQYGTAPVETEYEVVSVKTGISDDDFIQIVSGLEEGDIIIIDQNQVSQGAGFMAMGMPGGMPTGGMPGGGMPAGGMGANMGGNRNIMGGR